MNRERRQVEIISLAQNLGREFSIADLCEEFRVEVATIHRDLRELRAKGIPIHSVNGTVRVLRNLGESELRELLSGYLASAAGVISYPKNISLTVKKLKAKSVNFFVTLVKGIERREILELTYYKMFDDETVVRVIEPYDLIPTTREWRLITRSDGYFKQFLVENIREVRPMNRFFKRSPEYNPDTIFKNSIEYWLSKELFEAKLKISKRLAPIVKAGIWTEDQELLQMKDRSLVMKFKANSIKQTGNWILTWGGGIEILGPPELRKYVVQRAKGVLQTYNRPAKKTITR
jgi:predicted DNA-binding transcriptional regulator YafY